MATYGSGLTIKVYQVDGYSVRMSRARFHQTDPRIVLTLSVPSGDPMVKIPAGEMPEGTPVVIRNRKVEPEVAEAYFAEGVSWVNTKAQRAAERAETVARLKAAGRIV